MWHRDPPSLERVPELMMAALHFNLVPAIGLDELDHVPAAHSAFLWQAMCSVHIDMDKNKAKYTPCTPKPTSGAFLRPCEPCPVHK
ncbi:hypothetical protein PSEEN0711 [Pseudomonas entomophila L48]|uniref:Uncharacterized protein n=1 Tax=Pseudomonas entomophila (strain L48) TaxID=384676 RepID=Q1IFB7_PSEE4|nr:hypothetical protein PSEEN0711 [Pseudomonas entomophila L48]